MWRLGVGGAKAHAGLRVCKGSSEQQKEARRRAKLRLTKSAEQQERSAISKSTELSVSIFLTGTHSKLEETLASI